MNKKKAYELAAALESGKYKQTKRLLRSYDNLFCCLGVACDLTKQPWVLKNSYSFSILGQDTHIPIDLLKETDFGTTSGKFIKRIKVTRLNGNVQHFRSLIVMNDEGLSFKFIAKILRKHYKNII